MRIHLGLRYFPTALDGGLPRPAARHPRQVFAQHIDDGRKHKKQADPDTPIAMRPFPVRTLAILNTVWMRSSVPVVSALDLIYWLHAAPSISSYESPASPGRACRCTACAR